MYMQAGHYNVQTMMLTLAFIYVAGNDVVLNEYSVIREDQRIFEIYRPKF